MTKFDQFIHNGLKPRLHAEEAITTTGFLFTKSLELVALVGPLGLARSGYFLADQASSLVSHQDQHGPVFNEDGQ